MTKSNQRKISLTTKLADGRSVKARINVNQVVRHVVHLETMNDTDLRREIDSLPSRINQATMTRDKLFDRLRERWATAYVNDQAFVTAYAQAEAAGKEVVYLMSRAIEAASVWNERHSGKLL